MRSTARLWMVVFLAFAPAPAFANRDSIYDKASEPACNSACRWWMGNDRASDKPAPRSQPSGARMVSTLRSARQVATRPQ